MWFTSTGVQIMLCTAEMVWPLTREDRQSGPEMCPEARKSSTTTHFALSLYKLFLLFTRIDLSFFFNLSNMKQKSRKQTGKCWQWKCCSEKQTDINEHYWDNDTRGHKLIKMFGQMRMVGLTTKPSRLLKLWWNDDIKFNSLQASFAFKSSYLICTTHGTIGFKHLS